VAFGVDAALTWRHGTDAQITGDDRCQQAAERVVPMDALRKGDIDIDLLRVAGRGGGPPGRSKGARLPIHSACSPQEIRKQQSKPGFPVRQANVN
jgi:hypothetical protein